MTRSLAVTAALAMLAGGGVVTNAQRGTSPPSLQSALRQDVDGMTARMGGHASSRDVIADAQRLAGGYRSLGPLVRSFGPSDYAINREMARRSLLWLGRAGRIYSHDPITSRALLEAYDSIGLFYRNYGTFYAPGAYVAYAGAVRLAQRLALDPRRGLFLGDLDRYALAYGTLATLDGRFIGRWATPQDLPDTDSAAAEPAPPLKPVELPKVDASTLTPAQRATWLDARERFRPTAARVHAARQLLEQLSDRLRQQRLSLHPETAASAVKMQGFLEEAAELMQGSDFEQAIEALTRADYERGKLRKATGQSD